MSINIAHHGTHIPRWTTGERLRKAREDAGLSQDDLAREISISKRQIVYYENDTKTPKRGEFLLWQMVTNVPAVWLESGYLPNSGGPNGGESQNQEFRIGALLTHLHATSSKAA